MSVPLRPSQIEYKLHNVVAPRYTLVRVPLNNLPGGSTGPVGPTASTVLEWRLPAVAYNLARSYISYNINIPIQAAIGGAAASSVTFEDVFDLGQSITFGAASGMDLVNIPYAQNYSKVIRKITTPVEEMLTNGVLSGLYSSNALIADNVVPGGNLSGGAGNFDSCRNYTESRYSSIVAVDAAAENVYRQYPLGAFKGTLLGVDKDFYSPIEQYLRVTCGTGDKMAYITTYAGNDPAAAAASLNAALTVNNIYLYLCVEQNQDIINGLKEKCYTGQLKYTIPYLTASRFMGGQIGQQTNVNIQLPMQYGKRLKRIIHTVWNPQERLNTAYDQDNFNGAKTLNYQTSLDSINLQSRVLSCLAPAGGVIGGDDWLENQKFLGKSSSILSKAMYNLNWFHCDQFFEPNQGGIDLPEENLEEGLVMDTSKLWVFNCVPAVAALIHYTFMQFQREIYIDAMGPQWVASALTLTV